MRVEGLLLGSRELLCLSSQISRTLVSCSSLSELYLLGESVSCQMQGQLWAGGVTSFYRLARRGGFSEGLGTSRQSGADTSSRPLTGTGARHVTSLPSDRGATHHVAAYQGTMPSLRLSVGKFLPSPIQPVVPIPSERLCSLIHRICHAHTLTHSPGASA